MKRLLQASLFTVVIAFLALGQSMRESSDHAFFTTEDVKWSEGPASLPVGAKVAVLEGNPAEEGLFTMRLKLPAGYTIQPHWHPAVEHVTVISGTLYLGMGEKFDKSAGRSLAAGSFGFMAPGKKHFAWAQQETVIQVHGIGPWKVNYVNAVDDPRNKK